MKPGMKMAALMAARPEMGTQTRMGYHVPPYAGGMNMYSEMNNAPHSESYGAESAFRDRRGRRHYNNGRFAPKNEMEAYGGTMETFRGQDNNFRNDGGARQIGFYAGDEVTGDYRMDAAYNQINEMERRSGSMTPGRAKSTGGHKLTKEMAEEWVESMERADGGRGPKWQLDKVSQILARRGITSDPMQYWVAMNALYSDYCSVLSRHGIGDNADFYVDLAKAFIEDSDAMPDKLANYYECIVKH